MKIGKYILMIIALTNSINLLGSCNGEYFSITELLNHDPKNHHIFTCEILETYVRGHSYESIAVIRRRFRGNPNDTIFLNTGGGTTAGGQKLFPKSEWLIFSTSNDRVHYRATVCDYLSTKLEKGNNNWCQRDINPLGKVYIEILEEYEAIKRRKYSGNKVLKGNEKLVAIGSFKSGIPHGDWIHYSKWDEFEEKVKRSEISYNEGLLHGKYKIYHEDEDQNIIIEKRIYEFDFPVVIERESFHRYQKKYEYRSDRERVITSTNFDSLGIILKQFTRVEFDYTNKHSRIGYKHGYYLNKLSRDSSEYSPLGEGNYDRGTRIGEWNFFNRKGELIKTKVYPEKSKNENQFLIYDEQGKIRVSGRYIDDKRVGIWKYFYDGKLEFEEAYNSNGERVSKTHHYSSGGIKFMPYSNNQEHGQNIIFNKDNTIRSIENYENGRLNGLSIFFNDDGKILKESNFIQGREFTIRKNKNSSYVLNGFLNGHFIQYHYKTKKKMYEGDYWNGYRTGIWIEYGRNGSYTKMYYPTDKEELVNQCGHASPKLTEQFDKEGNLINSWKF